MNSVEPATKKVWTNGTLRYTGGGLAVLFCWLLLGDFAWSMRDRSVGPMSQWYLNHLEVPNLLFGLLVSSFPALIGVILGPIISVKSDRYRSKWGRRIPFLLITTPLAALGMLGLAVTPILAGHVQALMPEADPKIVAIACFGVFWAAFEIATIASQSVFGGLINDVVPTELLGRFYGLFRAVSLIDGMIFNYWIMGKVPDHFTLILTIIGVFYCVSFMWVCLKVKEGEYPPPPPREESSSIIPTGARQYFVECFSNPYYLRVFVMLTAAGLAFAPVNTFSIPYANNLGVDMDLFGKCLALTYLISLVLAYPLGWLVDRLHPLRMTLVFIACYVAVTIYGWFAPQKGETFLIAWVAHGVISGCYYTSSASLGQRLFPRVKYAQFASAAGIISSPVSMALAPAVGSMIDVSGKMYQLTFAVGAVLSILALIASIGVYSRFVKLGGPKNYIAPIQ